MYSSMVTRNDSGGCKLKKNDEISKERKFMKIVHYPKG